MQQVRFEYIKGGSETFVFDDDEIVTDDGGNIVAFSFVQDGSGQRKVFQLMALHLPQYNHLKAAVQRLAPDVTGGWKGGQLGGRQMRQGGPSLVVAGVTVGASIGALLAEVAKGFYDHLGFHRQLHLRTQIKRAAYCDEGGNPVFKGPVQV